jgi:hypothetical protein
MVIVAPAPAWLGAGCNSSASAPHDAATDSSATGLDAATDTAPPTAGPAICSLDATYTYGYDGGPSVFFTRTTLAPPASYERTTTIMNFAEPPGPFICTPSLPTCGDGMRVDVSDIARDLADPDVVHAMAMGTPPVHGLDPRPTDGVIFQLIRADGHGFLAGSSCETGQFCHGPVPAGIARLVADLEALDQQQLADPSCAPQNPPRL